MGFFFFRQEQMARSWSTPLQAAAQNCEQTQYDRVCG